MHIGENRNTHFLFDFRQNFQASFDAGAPIGIDRRAVGFVVRGFIDEGNPDSVGHLFKKGSMFESGIPSLDHTRASDQSKRVPATDLEAADPYTLRCHSTPYVEQCKMQIANFEFFILHFAFL
jgi:hypothetical protein